MSMIIGGDRAWRKYRKGDIGISYHWLDGDPAMFLFPATRQTGLGVVPFVIKLSVAHQYADSSGHPNLLNALPAAIDAARCLGMSSDPGTLHRIIDAIVDGIPDLVSMPPEPDWAKPESGNPTGDDVLSIKRDGEVVLEAAI